MKKLLLSINDWSFLNNENTYDIYITMFKDYAWHMSLSFFGNNGGIYNLSITSKGMLLKTIRKQWFNLLIKKKISIITCDKLIGFLSSDIKFIRMRFHTTCSTVVKHSLSILQNDYCKIY